MSEQSPFARVLTINLLVLLGYAIACKLFAAYSGGNEEQMFFVILMAMALALHVVVALLAALFLKVGGKRDASLGFLASALLVLLIGTGVCFGGAAIPINGHRTAEGPG